MSCAVGSLRSHHCHCLGAVLAARFLHRRGQESDYHLRRSSLDAGQEVRVLRLVKKQKLLHRQLARLYQ